MSPTIVATIMERFRQNPRTAGRVIDRAAFVVTPGDNKLHTLNRTGSLIWELAERGCTLDEAAAAVASRFDVPPDRARADTERFLRDLLERGILELASERAVQK